MALTDHEREYWTNLFLEEFEAEHAGSQEDTKAVHRRVVRAHAKDQDRENRAQVGRLRQEVRVSFFTERGYVEQPDSRGTMRFVDPKNPGAGRRQAPRPQTPEVDPKIIRNRILLGAAGLFTTLVVFGLVIGC